MTGVLHEVFEQLELLVGQIERVAVQAGRIAVDVHHQIAAAQQTVLLVAQGRRVELLHGVGSHRLAFAGQPQPSLHLGGRRGGQHHVRDPPFGGDHGESAVGQDQDDRYGQPRGVHHQAHGFGGSQVVAGVDEQDGVLGQTHDARQIQREHAHAVRQQRQRGQHGGGVFRRSHQRQIRHLLLLRSFPRHGLMERNAPFGWIVRLGYVNCGNAAQYVDTVDYIGMARNGSIIRQKRGRP